MILLLGMLIVLGSVLGGFLYGGGNMIAMMQVSEFLVIGGAAVGSLVIMSPRKVLVDMLHKIISAFKGAPYNQRSYQDLFKALYELFLLGRRNGMIALEEHVMNPLTSSIFTKYPSFIHNRKAVEFLCNGLRPIIDGKIKPDQLKLLMETELESLEAEHHCPVNVLTRTADAMPGFGIVAAVLGIVITMGSINGPIEKVGEHVAAALLGTFLGIFLSYGFMNPLAVNLEFCNSAELAYTRSIAASVVGFAAGMAPIMAVEIARRGLSSDVRPSADELEVMLKSLNAPKPKP